MEARVNAQQLSPTAYAAVIGLETFANTQRLSAAALAETLTKVLGTEVSSDRRGKSSLPDLTLLARKI
jgi:hypothetical protein